MADAKQHSNWEMNAAIRAELRNLWSTGHRWTWDELNPLRKRRQIPIEPTPEEIQENWDDFVTIATKPNLK